MNNELLKNIFDIIKDEEIHKFQTVVRNTISESISNGQLSSSTHLDKLNNLAKTTYKTTYDKLINKLLEDKQQSYIKINSKIFMNLIDAVLEDILDVIKNAHVNSSNSKYNDKSRKNIDKTFRPPLTKLKNELINNWNIQAKIETKKQQNKNIDYIKKGVFVSIILAIISAYFDAYFSQKLSLQNIPNKSQQNITIQKSK